MNHWIQLGGTLLNPQQSRRVYVEETLQRLSGRGRCLQEITDVQNFRGQHTIRDYWDVPASYAESLPIPVAR